MYTQCPECGVAFRVTADVLRQAAGKVRCGGCGAAFNALNYLSEEKPAAPVEPEPEPQLPELIPEQPAELEAGSPPQAISAAQSAALLKTLDQLAGSDIRIEDTGVEWRVLDDDEVDPNTEAVSVGEPDTDPAATELIADTGAVQVFAEQDNTRVDATLDDEPTPVDELLGDPATAVDSADVFAAEATGRHATPVDALLEPDDVAGADPDATGNHESAAIFDDAFAAADSDAGADSTQVDTLLDGDDATPVDRELTPDTATSESGDPGPADALEVMRFDDNTPLPDDFDLADAPAFVPAEPEPEPQSAAPAPEPEAPQPTEFTLSEPDEWEDLLDEFDEIKANLDEAAEALQSAGEDMSDATAEAAAETDTEDDASLEVIDATAYEVIDEDLDLAASGDEPPPDVPDTANEAELPPDTATQFALQAEALGIDVSGSQPVLDEAAAETMEEAAEQPRETTIDEDLIAAAFENEAGTPRRRHDDPPADDLAADAAGQAQFSWDADGDSPLAAAASGDTASWGDDDDIDAVLAGALPDADAAHADDDADPAADTEEAATADDEADPIEAATDARAESDAAEPGESEKEDDAQIESGPAHDVAAAHADGAAETDAEAVDPEDSLNPAADDEAEPDADDTGDTVEANEAESEPDEDAEDLEATESQLDGDDAANDVAAAADDDESDLAAAAPQADEAELDAGIESDEPVSDTVDADDIIAKLEAAEASQFGGAQANDDSSGEHFVPEPTEEEMTINRLIDQDLLSMAVEDEDGFASTIVQKQPDKAVEEEIAELKKTDNDAEPPPIVETIIMEGEFVESALDKESKAATGATGTGDARADLPPEIAAVRGGRRHTDPPSYRVVGGAVVLAIVLLLQVLHQSREALATVPAINKAISPIYRLIGQPLTPEWDISGWRFEATKGSTDENDELLTIYTRVGNQAETALPYPLLHVSLTDRFEEVIGSRVLEPAEYLASSTDPRRPVPAGNTFNAVISLATAAPEATGFKLNVCYRQADDKLRCAIEDFK